MGGLVRWASVGSVSLRDMQSDSKTDERGRSAPAVHVLTLNRVVRGRSRCRASSGHTCRRGRVPGFDRMGRRGGS